MSELQVIGVAVVAHEGQVLIGLRPPGKPLAGLWEFPGGKVQPQETPQEAAARECLEETGMAVRTGEPCAEVIHPYEHGPVRLVFVPARALAPSQQPRSPFRWVPKTALAEYLFPPANASIVARLVADTWP